MGSNSQESVNEVEMKMINEESTVSCFLFTVLVKWGKRNKNYVEGINEFFKAGLNSISRFSRLSSTALKVLDNKYRK